MDKFKHIVQFFWRAAASMAFQGFFAISVGWSIIEWLGFSMLMLMIVYLIEIPFIAITDID